MNTDTENFLEALLFVADSPDEKRRPFRYATIHDFHPEFVSAVEGFIDAFREHLETTGFDLDRLDDLERSFGGNVFFELSGHGCGFFDERDEDLAAVGKTLEAWAGNYRFEQLESDLYKFKGKNHVARRTAAFRREALAKYFGVPSTVSKS